MVLVFLGADLLPGAVRTLAAYKGTIIQFMGIVQFVFARTVNGVA